MSATLPHGLITISHSTAPNNDEPHYADVLFERSQILHSFWKVHAIRYRVSKDSSDFRCQNLFWRTWSDSKLSKTVKSTRLTSLWTSCQQAIDPDSLRKDFSIYAVNAIKLPNIDRYDSAAVFNSSDGEGKALPLNSTYVAGCASLHPSPAVQRIQGRRTSIDDSSGSGSTIDSRQKIARPPRPGLLRAGSSNSRTSFGVSTGKSKHRPSLSHRKSSQGASQARPNKPSKPPVRSPTTQPTEISKVLATTSPFELPSASSWEDEPTIGCDRLSNSASHFEMPSELVEPDFRNRFAERVASSNNLAGMSRMKKTGSVVRFADDEVMATSNMKDTESRPPGGLQRPSLSYRDSVASVGSIAVIDEDDMMMPGLVRTKSQLSMMIDENRSQPDRIIREAEESSSYANVGSRKRRELTEDEKLLAMAHGEGVTKAGGRSTRRGFRFSDYDESRYSSPSPPPLF